jgi:uncharacterized membrane protein (DUF485 family)
MLFSGGEERGLLVLLGVASAAAVVGSLLVWIRDGDVTTAAGAADEQAATGPTATESGPLPAAWPAIAALGVAVTVVGLAAGGLLLYVGLGILAIAVIEWMVQGWAERATPDAVENVALRNRIMYPLEIPILGLLIVGVVLLAFSRVLLALPKEGSTIAAIAVATLILLAAIAVATRPRVSSSLLTGVLVLGAVALLGGGVVGAVAGEREIEEHGAEEDHTAVEPETRPNDPETPTEDQGGTTNSSLDDDPDGGDTSREQSENPDAPDEETGDTTEVSSP